MNKETAVVKKSYHHGDLREKLVDEAVRLIRADGEVGLSMRKLATNVGVSRTAAYHHFKDKNDLLCAIAERGFRKLLVMHQRAAEEGVNPLSKEGALLLIKGYVKFATDNPEYYDLMFGGHLWKSKSLNESLKEVAFASFRASVDMIKQQQDQGLIAKDVDVLRFCQVRWSTMHGMARLLIDGIYVDSNAIESMCEVSVELMLKYLD